MMKMDYTPKEITQEEMLRELIRQEIGEHFQKQAMVSSESDAFYRQQSYIETLIRVQNADHNVHKEIDEALEKLKELTYQG
jgi:hypothetical protein